MEKCGDVETKTQSQSVNQNRFTTTLSAEIFNCVWPKTDRREGVKSQIKFN